MNLLIVLAHPDPSSFNHAIARTTREALQEAGHTVVFHDLHAEKFDPIIGPSEFPKDARLNPLILKHCDELAGADGLVVVHPNWWGQPPAILKGWVDRVFRPGVAYEFLDGDNGEGVPRGLLKLRAALVFNTANTPAEREQTAFGDPLERLWKDCIFGLCSNAVFHRKMFGVIVTSTDAQRAEWLREVRETVLRYFPHKRT